MSAAICGLCGKVATGLASIDDTRYCHGDGDLTPTCYERAQWARWESCDCGGCTTSYLLGADDTARDHDDERDADLSDHGDLR